VDLSIVIPCYNEADNVPKIKNELFPVLEKLAETKSVEVIFIDDGSADGTFDALHAAFGRNQYPNVSVDILQHSPNKGLGAAIRTGLAAAQGDIIVTTDSDGTYRFTEIPALISYLTPDVDIVTASPYHPDGDVVGVPAYRLILSRGSSLIYRILADWNIHTYTALFRAYRRTVTLDVPFESNGFLGGTELMVNALRMGYKVAEYPTALHSRVHGESKAKLVRTIKAHINFQVHTLLPWHPYGLLLRGSDDTVYLYNDFQKHPFLSKEVFVSHGYRWDQVINVIDSYLAGLNTGAPIEFREGTLLRAADETVYVISNKKKRAFATTALFESMGYSWHNVITVPDNVLHSVEIGPIIASNETHPDGTLVKSPESDSVHLLEDGTKRLFASEQVFRSWNYRWEQIVTISADELARYSTGTPIVPQKSIFRDEQQLSTTTYRMQQEQNLVPTLTASIYFTLNKYWLGVKNWINPRRPVRA
jgi:dolichol-phosphate mannosyltransferase